jgi:hypothetical protein
MKIRRFLQATLLVGVLVQTAHGQAGEKVLFIEADLLRGVGRYNGLTWGAGLNGRVQYPLTPTLAVTGNVGVEYYRIRYYDYGGGYSYLGYGINPITGGGINTIYWNPGSAYEDRTSGVSLPVTVGPRLYLPNVANGLHAGLNLGADIAGTRATLRTSFHFSPVVGFIRPLGNGRYLDLTAYYATSFTRYAGGVVGLSAAYGLPLGSK